MSQDHHASQNSPAPLPHSAKGVIFLTIFLDLVGFSIIFPIFPALMEHYLAAEGDQGLFGQVIGLLEKIHPGHGEVGGLLIHAVLFGGLLGTLYSLFQFLFAPFWGRLSDHFGRRTVLLWTVGGTALSYFLWLFSESFLFFLVARVFSGAMAGNLAVATAAISDVTSRQNRSRGMALVGIAFGLGFILGPALGGLSATWLVASWLPGAGWIGYNPFAGPALLAAILACLNWLWVWRKFPETLAPSERASFWSRREKKLRAALSPVFPRALRKTNLLFLLYIIAFSGMEFTLTFLAFERFGFGPRAMIGIFLFVGFFIVLTQGVLVRRWGPRWGEKPMTAGGLGLVSAGLVVLALAPNLVLLYTGLFLMAVGSGLVNPAVASLISLYAPTDRQGQALGIFRSLGALGRAFGPIFAAIIFWWYSPMIAYLVGAILMIPSLALVAFLPAPTKTSPEIER